MTFSGHSRNSSPKFDVQHLKNKAISIMVPTPKYASISMMTKTRGQLVERTIDALIKSTTRLSAHSPAIISAYQPTLKREVVSKLNSGLELDRVSERCSMDNSAPIRGNSCDIDEHLSFRRNWRAIPTTNVTQLHASSTHCRVSEMTGFHRRLAAGPSSRKMPADPALPHSPHLPYVDQSNPSRSAASRHQLRDQDRTKIRAGHAKILLQR